ncbi:hypothetical protein HHI36_021966 [Cryptolaemus montrouzieri]|uniref:Homologous recombination OB-fold protein OB-fold domain-containing protein n=1 Tax=Cryptolaemus montrouzieri TaxID=559131 RepID=A0ABD2MYC1_9CUCU
MILTLISKKNWFQILNCSQPTNQTLKRSCSELFENEANKKLKTVSKTCINANNSPLSSRESIESSTSHLEPENFHSTKTSTTSENQNQRSIQQVNLSQQASTSRNNFIAEKVYVNKNTEKHVDNKICRLKSSDSNATRRKFPGPAGILPERGFNAHMSEHLDRSASSESKDEICSQTTGFIFSDGPWERMKVDHLPKSNGETFLPDKYNIHWIKNKVIMKKLINQKAPFLAAFVHSIRSHSIQNPIVNLTLKDKTGTIQGTILHNLYEEYSSDLSVGSVIVLKDISVLNTGSNNEPYLTITPNNLISIYTSNQKSGNSQNSSSQNSNTHIYKVCVQSISAGEILSNINELKRLYKLEIDNSKRNIQRISSKIEIGGKTSICDNFKRQCIMPIEKKVY